MGKKVRFKTADGIKIVGNFSPSQGGRAVLLLHMMPSTKESWEEFSQRLVGKGFSVLAIDLRGHGESIYRDGKDPSLHSGTLSPRELGDKVLSFESFGDTQHQESIRDIRAAEKFLSSRGKKLEAIVGASIGANLALWYQSEHFAIKKVILLSAGFNYRGIKTEPLASRLSPDQGLYTVGGSRDACDRRGDCGAIARRLIELVPSLDKKAEVLETGAHGTDLLALDPLLGERLVRWLL